MRGEGSIVPTGSAILRVIMTLWLKFSSVIISFQRVNTQKITSHILHRFNKNNKNNQIYCIMVSLSILNIKTSLSLVLPLHIISLLSQQQASLRLPQVQPSQKWAQSHWLKLMGFRVKVQWAAATRPNKSEVGSVSLAKADGVQGKGAVSCCH